MQESAGIKIIYNKIQSQLLCMIPEKWSKIYLYASVAQNFGNFQTGEMFFYYFPKGILKKNPINSYEIPLRFNIDEQEYLKLAADLYDLIKGLKKEFKNQGKKLWTSLTIKLEGTKFAVEFYYDELPILQEQIEARHILWAYKNLEIPMETLSKNQKKLLQEELEKRKNTVEYTTTYSETMYRNPVKNIIRYNKEKVLEKVDDNYEIKTQILNMWA